MMMAEKKKSELLRERVLIKMKKIMIVKYFLITVRELCVQSANRQHISG
jgi:hypothetical protein